MFAYFSIAIASKRTSSMSSVGLLMLKITLLLQLLHTSATAAEGAAGFTSTSYGDITYGVVNSSLIIPCGALQLVDSQQQAEYNVSWYKGGHPLEITGDVSVTDGSLSIARLTRELTGDYNCDAWKEGMGTLVGAPVKLRLGETPPMVFDETRLALFPGDALRLACPVAAWAPIIAINWFKDALAIDIDNGDDRFESLPGGILLVSNLTESDAGDYTCSSRTIDNNWVMSNNSVNVSFNASEKLKSYTIFARPPSNFSAMLRQSATLECGVNPSAGETAVWFKKEFSGWRPVEESDNIRVKPNQYLRWKVTDGSITGEYQCQITSSAGQSLESFTTVITLVYPPTLSDPHYRELSSKPFAVAKLTCDIVGSPAPTLTWYKDGEPLDMCHNIHMSEDGTLSVERAAPSDSGLYQCMASNVYGTESLYHKVTIPVINGTPETLVITEGRFTRPLNIRVDWEVKQAELAIMYYTIVYTEERCLPHILSDSGVEPASDPTLCRPCEGRNLLCCNKTIEVPTAQQDYKIYVIAYNVLGGKQSQAFIVPALVGDTTTPLLNKTLGLNATDFGSVILVRWQPVEGAAGYNVNILSESHAALGQDGAYTAYRSSEQLYYVYQAPNKSSNLVIQVEAVQEPIRYRQVIEVKVDRPWFTGVPPAQTVTVASHNLTGAMVFWTQYPDASSYFLWYNCDGREKLASLGIKDQYYLIEAVDSRCQVVLAPVVGEAPRPAGMAFYERWCKAIPTPANVKVLPYEGEGLSGYPMEVTWTAKASNKTCEVDYLVRWKTAIADVFSERDSFIVRNKYRAVVKELKVDFTYEFQVVAFTNASDTTRFSDTVSYTIGPPLNAKNVMMNTARFPNGPAVLTWSRAQSPHSINLYVVMLFEWRNGVWSKSNLTTVNASAPLSVKYNNLLPDTRYTVNISSVNSQGEGGVTTCLFTTPALITTSTDYSFGSTAMLPLATEENTRGKIILTHAQLGVIIGFALSVVVIFITVTICIIFRKRFKREERILRQCRNRSSRFASSPSSYSCQQPLTVDTSHHEMSAGPPKYTLANGNGHIEHCHPLTVLNSPGLPTNQVTSGKDSGIDGVAEDHRSSQNLEEYDDEGGALISSSLSLNSQTSAEPVFSQRWSGDPCYNVEAAGHSRRLRAESECDSLLTDSHRPDTPTTLHSKLLTKSAIDDAAGCQPLKSQSSRNSPDLTLHVTGV